MENVETSGPKGTSAPKRVGPASARSAVVREVLNRGYGDAGASHIKKALKGFRADSGHPNEDINENN